MAGINERSVPLTILRERVTLVLSRSNGRVTVTVSLCDSAEIGMWMSCNQRTCTQDKRLTARWHSLVKIQQTNRRNLKISLARIVREGGGQEPRENVSWPPNLTFDRPDRADSHHAGGHRRPSIVVVGIPIKVSHRPALTEHEILCVGAGPNRYAIMKSSSRKDEEAQTV
jgi:hypothetical protein